MEIDDSINHHGFKEGLFPVFPIDSCQIGSRYQVIGRFESTHCAESLLATDIATGETVVVQFAVVSNSSESEWLQLEHEATVLGEVDNPFLARPLDIGQEDGRLYVVRPYKPGMSLRRRLLRSRLELSEALSVASCLFSVLRDVHARGVLHHDIRSTNVIVDDTTPLKTAMVTGQFILAFPIVTGLTFTSVRTLDKRIEETILSLGATIPRLSLPLAP